MGPEYSTGAPRAVSDEVVYLAEGHIERRIHRRERPVA